MRVLMTAISQHAQTARIQMQRVLHIEVIHFAYVNVYVCARWLIAYIETRIHKDNLFYAWLLSHDCCSRFSTVIKLQNVSQQSCQ